MVMSGAFHADRLGLAIGVPVALALRSLYQIAALRDHQRQRRRPAWAIVTLAIAGCVAAILPARRAANTDPVQALRME